MSRRAILSFAAGFLFAAILGWVGLDTLVRLNRTAPEPGVASARFYSLSFRHLILLPQERKLAS
jgi:hypothetical protein